LRRRFDKQLYSNRREGSLPQLIVAQNEQMQSRYVVQKVLELREEGVPLDTIAVLFRSSFLSFDLEIELSRADIPFQKFGGFKFIETAHVKDMIAYLRVLENPRDMVAWHRILLLVDGVGPRTSEKILDDIAHRRVSQSGSDYWPEYGAYPEGARELFDLLKSLVPFRKNPAEIASRVLTFYRPTLKGKYDDYHKRMKDLEMFGQIASRYDDVPAMLTDLALEPPNESVSDVASPGPEREFLVLSTIHSAKGLEWHSVFVIYALDGRFPSLRAVDDPDELEEERRLMYVACTRAKENLFITYPMNIYDRESGLILTKPSRFLEGLNDKLLEPWVVNEE